MTLYKTGLIFAELDANGCPSGNECLPKPGPGCIAECPPVCGSMEILCVDTDPATGCPVQSECMPSTDARNCPTVCNPNCLYGQSICELFDVNGCLQKTCISPADTCESMYIENGCVNHHPPICPENNGICPGGIDENGCEKLPLCRHIGHACPASCDDRHEKSCSKGKISGIGQGTNCINKTIVINEVLCENHCGAGCDWKTERACPLGYDILTGCPLRDECRDIDTSCLFESYISKFIFISYG